MVTQQPISVVTDPGMLTYLPADKEILHTTQMNAATALLIYKTQAVYRWVFKQKFNYGPMKHIHKQNKNKTKNAPNVLCSAC